MQKSSTLCLHSQYFEGARIPTGETGTANIDSRSENLSLRAQQWVEQHRTTHLLKTNEDVNEVFPDAHHKTAETLNVIVSEEKLVSNENTANSISSILESWKSKHIHNPIPPVDSLCAIATKPLFQSDKILLEDAYFSSLLSAHLPDICTEKDIEKLFILGDTTILPFHAIFSAIASAPPPPGTDSLFIHFWDGNIRIPLEILIPRGRSIRSDNSRTEVQLGRPCFGFLVNNICVFRGEEVGSYDSEDPKEALRNKINWVYDDAEYLLGYYCRGYEITLVAILPPSRPGEKPAIKDLVTTDLHSRLGRIANIQHLINLSIQEFESIPSWPHSAVEITSFYIVKTYTGSDAERRVQRLAENYSLLAKDSVPYTDNLVSVMEKCVWLQPRGISTQPLEDLKNCLICISKALVVAHKIPLYHQDIRWSNIMRKFEDPSEWLLIDWEDAATPPTFGRPNFTPKTHSPEILHDGHGAEIDIWGVGHLIKTCTASNVPPRLLDFGDRLRADSFKLCAADILHFVTSDL
ncbi:hypothetical protein CPB83DRAFT_906517 [Crepidotus variabilis]|uniref:Protein kinase domain-containing protein n=1 Tax=Crepidotus variabilis TaxID=179855 RepID=A0A9P6EGU9_9AGAR|nr:hypothetical protein CPB83DRAFT_906517 [Crepidotus variabilis]